MGRYQREYERDWRDFTRQMIAERFGANALQSFSCVTQSDERELRETLATAGIAHVPPNHSRWYAHTPSSQTCSVASDHLNSFISDDSYVYNTPPPSDSQSAFPTFSSQEFAFQLTSERRVSGSQRLKLRIADVSPITESRRTSIENARTISPPSGPAKSPWTPGQWSPKPTRKTRRTPRRSLESSFQAHDNLDVSMQSLHLSDEEQTHDVEAEEVKRSGVVNDGEKKAGVLLDEEQENEVEQVETAVNEHKSVEYGDADVDVDADDTNVTKELVFMSDNEDENAKQGQKDDARINAETIAQEDNSVVETACNEKTSGKSVHRSTTVPEYTETAPWDFEPDGELGPDSADDSDNQLSQEEKQGVETCASRSVSVERSSSSPIAFQSVGEPTQEDDRGSAQQQDIATKSKQVSAASLAKGKNSRKPKQTVSTKRAAVASPTISLAKRAPANSSVRTNNVCTTPKASTAARKRRLASPSTSSARQATLASTSLTSDQAMTSSSTSRSSRSTLPRKRVKQNALLHTKLPLQMEYRFASDRRRRHKRRKSHASKPSVFPYVVPELLVELQPYQKEALHWMLDREIESGDPVTIDQQRRGEATAVDALVAKVCGGILADEMGLGKTVCCLALICESLRQARAADAHTRNESGNTVPRLTPPTLIVTPLSILSQWEHEIRAKTNLSVVTYQGVTRKRFRSASQFMGADIVLSTYDTLRFLECKTQVHDSDKDDNEDRNDDTSADDRWRLAPRLTPCSKKSVVASKLHQMQWFRIILDESHLIANAGCGRARAAFTLKSRRRWCVTGTPIQNRTADLAALLQFVGLGNRAHSLSENELGALLPRIIMRRLKSTVDAASCAPILELPKKLEEIIELDFASDVERVLYMLLHRFTKTQVLRYLQSKEARQTCRTPLATPSKGGEQYPQFMHVFELILRLRQVCDASRLMTADPFAEIQKRIENAQALVGNAGADGTSPFSVEETEMIERLRMQRLDANSESGQSLLGSTKLTALMKELKKVRARRERVLVISEWTSFLDMIGECLMAHNAQCEARALSLGDAMEEGNVAILFAKLDGRMPAKDRELVVRCFQQQQEDRAGGGPPLDVLLLSLRTGGLGLNLTAATHVFIMEPSWNPSLERQAIDRAHRFGQTKEVRVVRFIIKGSIEERVVALQDKKRQLTAAFLGDGDLLSSATKKRLCNPRLSPGDLKRLFFIQDEEEGFQSHENGTNNGRLRHDNGGKSDGSITCIEISDEED